MNRGQNCPIWPLVIGAVLCLAACSPESQPVMLAVDDDCRNGAWVDTADSRWMMPTSELLPLQWRGTSPREGDLELSDEDTAVFLDDATGEQVPLTLNPVEAWCAGWVSDDPS